MSHDSDSLSVTSSNGLRLVLTGLQIEKDNQFSENSDRHILVISRFPRDPSLASKDGIHAKFFIGNILPEMVADTYVRVIHCGTMKRPDSLHQQTQTERCRSALIVKLSVSRPNCDTGRRGR
jgi:hypothetical protein